MMHLCNHEAHPKLTEEKHMHVCERLWFRRCLCKDTERFSVCHAPRIGQESFCWHAPLIVQPSRSSKYATIQHNERGARHARPLCRSV